MSGVSSIAPLPGGTPYTGAVGFSSTSPAIIVGQNSGSNAITFALGNIGGVKTLNTQNGDLNMIMSDGMGIVESAGGNLLLHPYFPLSGTATTATLVAGNLNGASPLAWQGASSLSTVAYVPGAVVIYSSTTYVCLVAQPIGSAPPSNGANWQSIGGGGGGGGNWSYQGAWNASNAYVSNDVVFDPTASDARFNGYIALSNIPASSNAPWTSAGQSSGWSPYFNTGIVGFNNGSNASNANGTTLLSMNSVGGSPPPTGSNGSFIMTVINQDGGGGGSNVYTDFCAGRFVVAGVNTGLAPTGSNTLPFITTTDSGGSNIQLSVNGGGNQPVNIVGGLTVDGVPISAGGSNIANGGATLGIDSNADLTYVSSSNVGATNNITLTSDTNSGALGSAGVISLITTGTSNSARLQVGGDIAGGLSTGLYVLEGNTVVNTSNFNVGYTSNATSLNVSGTSLITLQNAGSNDSASLTMFNDQSNTFRSELNATTVLGYTPTVAGASNVVALQGGGSNSNAYADFGAGAFLVLGQSSNAIAPQSGAGIPFITATQSNAGTASNAIVLELNTGAVANTSNATSVNIVADALTLNGVPFTGGGGNMNYQTSNFAWNASNVYAIGDIASLSNLVYVASAPGSNLSPPTNTGSWQPIGSTLGGGGIQSIEINGATPLPTSGTSINFIPGAGISMSNTGSNTINISASTTGTGAYLTSNASSWEWAGSNTYATTQGIVSYQGGLYANIQAPSSNIPPFGASNSTTDWAGLAPSISLGLSNITPLSASPANAYTYSFVPGSNGIIDLTSPNAGEIMIEAQLGFTLPAPATAPVEPVSGLFTLQSSTANIVITTPGNGIIDLNVDAPAMNYSSLWTATVAYQIDDVVIYGEGSWVCLVATTPGESPDNTPASWRILGTVPTALPFANPADMVAGYVANMALVGGSNAGYLPWNSSNAYRPGNVISGASGGVYTSLTTNTNIDPASTPGSNTDWVNTGFVPVASTLQIQFGSNVPTNLKSSPPIFPYEMLDFQTPLEQTYPIYSTFGGCVATFTGTGTFATTTVGMSNAGNITGVQLFDSGTSNVVSYSAPFKFNPVIPYVGGGGGQTVQLPDFTCSITTLNTPTPPNTYSLVLFSDVANTGETVGGTLTGTMAYQFSGTGSNLSFN